MASHHPDSEQEKSYNTDGAADVLGISPVTLNQWRLRGKGPAFRRYGRLIRYTRADLIAYMDACKVGGGRP